MQSDSRAIFQPLQGVRILSLALNLPGPAALMRLRAMGAWCVKLEPPASGTATAGASSDPMTQYSPAAYADLTAGVHVVTADLKSEHGQATLHRELAQADVLITSFRPAALLKLGLNWERLGPKYPRLSQVAIVGGAGPRAGEAGHDLTYQAEQGLITGQDLPPSLYADMTGALITSEAVLQALLNQRSTGQGAFVEVALNAAAAWAALPRSWGMTLPGTPLGGGHAAYRVYECRDGRVALAALEPHFAKRVALAAGLDANDTSVMASPATAAHLRAYFSNLTRAQLDLWAAEQDIPLYTLPPAQ